MTDPFAFPQAFDVTDEASLAGQRAFIQSTRMQLMLLVIAGAAGSLSWTFNGDWDGTALLAGVAFTTTAVLRLAILRSLPHRAWFSHLRFRCPDREGSGPEAVSRPERVGSSGTQVL